MPINLVNDGVCNLHLMASKQNIDCLFIRNFLVPWMILQRYLVTIFQESCKEMIDPLGRHFLQKNEKFRSFLQASSKQYSCNFLQE